MVAAEQSEGPQGTLRHDLPELRRVLTFWPLLFYSLGIIVGAGVYVAIGSVIAKAGAAAPISFVVAGLTAVFTGLCYAELASRFPDAAGAAVYVERGFRSRRLGQLVGAAVAMASLVAAASIAQGAVSYLSVILPLPAPLLTTVLVISFTAIAFLGVRRSVGLAALIGALEIAGLLIAAAAGFAKATSVDLGAMIAPPPAAWPGVISGAFIAFFAFIGFETLTNLAEETKDATRTVPRGIIGAVAASTTLYVLVAAAVVASGATGANPLVALFEGGEAQSFAALGFVSIANGVLVEIVMLARLFYGMSRNRLLPEALARVNPRTRTPALATVVAGGLLLTMALLIPFGRLLVLTNALTLSVFMLVAASLWRLHRQDGAETKEGSFRVRPWVPLVAMALSLALLIGEFLG